MKDFWKRMFELYPKAYGRFFFYSRKYTTRFIPVLPRLYQIGLALQFIQDNEWVRPNELTSELYAPSGDFIDNACQIIEEFLELLEEKL